MSNPAWASYLIDRLDPDLIDLTPTDLALIAYIGRRTEQNCNWPVRPAELDVLFRDPAFPVALRRCIEITATGYLLSERGLKLLRMMNTTSFESQSYAIWANDYGRMLALNAVDRLFLA